MSRLSYQEAGVDIAAGNSLVEQIKPLAAATKRPEVMAGLGGFGALFELPVDRYKKPVLVSGTDGVGTKLKVAMAMKQHHTVGIDLVAMCVNDIVTLGAEPLYFLDYYATGHLQVELATDIVKGIAQGCEQAGCALIGGETAEMPGMYSGDDYDLAGFSVGVVEKDKIIDGSLVQEGDVLLGMASNGVHANGFSLVRKILQVTDTSYGQEFEGVTLGEALLQPTRIYVKPLLKLFAEVQVKALSHITGGGLLENLPRVLPDNCDAVLDKSSWQRPEIFSWLQTKGNVAEQEMLRTFNCGVGMVVCVAAEHAEKSLQLLRDAGETVWQLGVIEHGEQQVRFDD